MDYAARPILLLAALACLAISGCTERPHLPAWMPFQPKRDYMPGVPSPSERIENLTKLSERATSTGDAEKLQISQNLVLEIQKEEDPLLRIHLLQALAHYPSPSGDAVLRVAVNDPDADVRVAVCEIWGRRGDADAAQILAGMLAGDIDRDVRLAAARALGSSRDQIAVTALGTALEDNDPAMQYRAVASLRESTGQDLGNDVNRWREYAKNGTLKAGQPASLADRVRRVF